MEKQFFGTSTFPYIEDESDDVKNKILIVFRELAFSKGLKNLLIDDIAKSLKISKKTIYKYYESKYELVKELVGTITDDITTLISENSKRFDTPLENFIAIHVQITKYLLNMNRNLLSDVQQFYPELWRQIENKREENSIMFGKIIDEGIEKGIFKKINSKIALQIFMSSVHSVVNPEFLERNYITFDEALEDIIMFFMDGIKA